MPILALLLTALAAPTCDEVWAAVSTSQDVQPWARERVLEACERLPADLRVCLDADTALPPACRAQLEDQPAWMRAVVVRSLNPPTAWRLVPMNAAAFWSDTRHHAAVLLAALLALIQLALWPAQRRALDPVAARHHAAAWAIAATSAAIAWWAAPHGPFHSNGHGLDRLAVVMDGRPSYLAGILHAHGEAWALTLRPLTALLGDPFAACLALETLAVLLLFRFAAAVSSAPVGLAAAAIYALHPVHLRLAVSDDMSVTGEVALLAALLAVLAWRRDPRPGFLFLAAGWTAWAMQSRLDALLLAPWTVGLFAAHHVDRATLTRAARHPGTWAALAVVALSVSPQVLNAVYRATWLAEMASTGQQTFDLRWLGWPAGAAAWVAVALPSERRAARALFALVSAALAAALLGGAHLASNALTHGVYHVWVDPQYSPPWWAALTVLGLAHVDRRLASWWVLATVPAMQLPATIHDAIGTYLRTAPLALWLLSLGAAWGLAALPRRAQPPLVLAALLLASWPWRGVVTQRYEKQELWDVIQAARERLPPRAIVTTLTADDAPADFRGNGDSTGRGDPALWLQDGGERVVIGLDRLDQWDHTDAPTYFVRTPACYGMLLLAGERQVLRDGVVIDLGRAVVDRVSAAPRGVPVDQTAHSTWEDARCRAIFDRYETETLIEWTFEAQRSGTMYESLYNPNPTVGVYRLVGRRGGGG
jgi:hypothetical protein